MAWGRVDDRFWRHAKVARLDPRLRKGAICLYWMALSWSNDELTDGRVPTGALRLLGAVRTEAEELVRVGLWERDETDGWRIHDFLDRNQSADRVRAIRAVRSRAGKAGADSKWSGTDDGNEHGKPDGKPNGNGHAPPHARGVSRYPSLRREEDEGSTATPGAVGRANGRVDPVEGPVS